MKKTFLSIVLLTLLSSCGTSKDSATDNKPEQTKRQIDGERQKQDPEAMFTQMDINSDGKLSKEEVKGPLAEKFTEIDTDKDGFISKEEMKNAPRPERDGQRQGGQGRR